MHIITANLGSSWVNLPLLILIGYLAWPPLGCQKRGPLSLFRGLRATAFGVDSYCFFD
jgi:hypothetical protein